MGQYLGCHATEEAAAQAYDTYVKDGVVPVMHRDTTSSQLKGVRWDKGRGKWQARCKGRFLGYHATEEAAAAAYDNYVEDGVDPVTHREGTSSESSRFKGVWRDKGQGKWKAECKGKYLGYHATEDAAAQAVDNYVQDGVVPVSHRDATSTSQFKGVCWDKRRGKWKAKCKGKTLGYHATEEAAARAYNTEAGRVARVDINVVPPGGDADGNNTAARALLRMFASAHTHAGAGCKRSKRAGAPTTPAPPQRKKMRLDTLAGAAAGARAAAPRATRGQGHQ